MLSVETEPGREICISLRAQDFNPTHAAEFSVSACAATPRLTRSTVRGGRDPEDPRKDKSMKVTSVLSLAAVGALLMIAAPASPTRAMSLSNPGAAAAVQQDARATTEVRWHHHHWHRWHHRHWRHRW
jgi:hypothetical protein